MQKNKNKTQKSLTKKSNIIKPKKYSKDGGGGKKGLKKEQRKI